MKIRVNRNLQGWRSNMEFAMSKTQLLDVIKLLSALESWSFAEKHRLPDYLLEDLQKSVEVVTKEILK